MRPKTVIKLLVISFLFSVLTSCGTVRTLPETKKKISGMEAMSFLEVPEGKSLIYVLRPSIFGYAIRMPVTIDNVVMGSTHGKRFLYAFVDPGQHTIRGEAENEFELSINTEADEMYFVKQKSTFGIFYSRNKLVSLSEDEAIGMMQKCKLADNNLETTGFENNPYQRLHNIK